MRRILIEEENCSGPPCLPCGIVTDHTHVLFDNALTCQTPSCFPTLIPSQAPLSASAVCQIQTLIAHTPYSSMHLPPTYSFFYSDPEPLTNYELMHIPL